MDLNQDVLLKVQHTQQYNIVLMGEAPECTTHIQQYNTNY